MSQSMPDYNPRWQVIEELLESFHQEDVTEMIERIQQQIDEFVDVTETRIYDLAEENDALRGEICEQGRILKAVIMRLDRLQAGLP